jgi:hypothetical protein
MLKEWQELTKITRGMPLIIETVRLKNEDITIGGEFELPPLARLTFEDQIFVAAFVKSHGSIKEMEKLFGVSYPTIKSRLNRISDQLEFLKIDISGPGEKTDDTLDRLERGEITVDEALDHIKNRKHPDK